MTKDEAIKELTELLPEEFLSEYTEALDMAIKALEKDQCGDCIDRKTVMECFVKAKKTTPFCDEQWKITKGLIEQLPPVTPQPNMGHCKDCKYFEYDSVAKVNGIPLIVAHEICSRWGDGCKTREDGYCFLFEPKMQEVEE